MLAHRLLGGCNSSLSISCPSLLSVLIAVARTRLWSLFRWCSESPLLTQPETMVSCLLGRSRLFPGLPPGSLWRTSPLQAVFTLPAPVLSLSLNSKAGASATRPCPPWWLSRQAFWTGACWSAPNPLYGNLSTLFSSTLLLRSPPWL